MTAAAKPEATTADASRDPRIDAYIERAAEFAQPLLRQLRDGVHAAHPGISETIKWGMPHFMYGGRILANMAAFKAHATFGFWQGEAVAATGKAGEAMGQFGRLTGPKDLPSAARLKAMVRQATALIDAGAPPRRNRRSAEPKPPAAAPDFFREALARHPAAQATFEGFPPSQQREYIEWLAEAKQAATRERRLAQALQWLAEGKRRHWKYVNC
ncbi:YdeI family protein [Ideonella sp.]|uniref:YdeI/OmpD-associated family protein n=1 Tax=Ideonella sp. TaxID=1929293 RepID=UPI0035AF5AE7